MRSRLATTVLLSIGVFIVVSLFVSVGVLWWTGDATRGVRIGVCGAVAVFTVGAVSWAGRSENAPATSTSDLGVEGIAEQGVLLRNTMLLLYSPECVEGRFCDLHVDGNSNLRPYQTGS